MDAPETIGGTGKVATPWAIEAYKTYLFRKGNRSVKDIEAMRAGHPIDVSDLDVEIAALEKTIVMCHKLSLPTWEEINKLKGLKGLRDRLYGTTWPSMADLKQAAQTPLKDQQKAAELAKAHAELQELKLANTAWYAPPKPPSTPHKAWAAAKPKVVNAPVKIGATVGRSKLDQEWIMRIGIASNLNVSILQENGGLGSLATLRCKVCSCAYYLNGNEMGYTTSLPERIETFCRTHRHEPKSAPAPAGRLFRDED